MRPRLPKFNSLDWHRVRRRRLCYQYENTAPSRYQELFFARSMILHAARAAGIAAIDTVYSDVDNTEGFEAEVRLIKQLGFDGKSVINPRQIPLVNTIYAPTEKEIQNAKEVIWGIREAEAKGSGVISVNGKWLINQLLNELNGSLR